MRRHEEGRVERETNGTLAFIPYPAAKIECERNLCGGDGVRDTSRGKRPKGGGLGEKDERKEGNWSG